MLNFEFAYRNKHLGSGICEISYKMDNLCFIKNCTKLSSVLLLCLVWIFMKQTLVAQIWNTKTLLKEALKSLKSDIIKPLHMKKHPKNYLVFKNGQAKGGLIAEILTVLFIGSEFWQLGFTRCFFMGTETLGCGGSRGR